MSLRSGPVSIGDGHKSDSKAFPLLSGKLLANCARDGFRLALSGQFGELANQPLSFRILDVYAHSSTLKW